ncbi:response regulator [Candidatus Woesearchaeota archaeon]|nr:response regulator [Candidatus Woesearchaeota archaeon]
MGRTILIVDDEAEIRNIFEQAFSQKGYEVRLSESAEEALEILKQGNINVMFLDLNLPGMNGIELCKQIKKMNPIAIIYAVTGYASIFEVVACRDAGFDDYFAKPVDLEILLKAGQDAFEKIDRWKGGIKS